MKKKRRMPKHIVLPNGMWRFVKSGTKAVSRKVRVKRARRRIRGVVYMARRRRTHHRRGIMGGSGVNSLVRSALIGVGTAHFAGYVPVNIPFKEEAAGAAGAYLVGGKNIKSAAVGAAAVYVAKMLSGGTTNAGGNY